MQDKRFLKNSHNRNVQPKKKTMNGLNIIQKTIYLLIKNTIKINERTELTQQYRKIKFLT